MTVEEAMSEALQIAADRLLELDLTEEEFMFQMSAYAKHLGTLMGRIEQWSDAPTHQLQ